MMKTYIIGYDLNRPGQEYAELYEAIKAYANWWHYLDSTWIVKTNSSATEIRDNLRQHIDQNDELLVLRYQGDAAWAGFDPKASKWLKDNLSDS